MVDFRKLYVSLGAALWASDLVIRKPLGWSVNAFSIVFFEHLFGAAFALPFAWKNRAAVALLRPADWVKVFAIGFFGSVLATILITQSFIEGNASVSVLLQKFQPVIVIALSYFMLGERVTRGFLAWGALALAGVVMLTVDFSTLGFSAPSLYALAAAVLWAVSTVLGKMLVDKLEPKTMTGLRLAAGLLTMLPLFAFFRLQYLPQFLPNLVLLALVPGAIALMFYYKGMRHASASETTLLELAFPLAAVALNFIAFGQGLSATQAAGGIIVVIGVLKATSVRNSSRSP